MNWSAGGNVLNQYLRNTSIGTTVSYNDRFRPSCLDQNLVYSWNHPIETPILSIYHSTHK
jgi:hypothetical protein